jgi:type I restriction-modification system DNA methylase subunit
MIPKATEDTITMLLKEELEKLGVKAEPFSSIVTPAGTRKPDLVCANGGMYLIEAKFSERDLIVAIAKVQNDYLKHYKVLGIKGGFAILYAEELARPMPIEAVRDLAMESRLKLISMFPPEDARSFNVYEGSLPQVAKTIAEHVLTPPKYVEPSIDYIIKSLRDSAMYILNGLRHLASNQLEGFFGGKDVFKNILQYEEGKYPEEELKFAAAYLLVNQLLFYHALSRFRPEFQEVDPDIIVIPSDLNQYFRKVLDINYKMVFSYDVASLIPPKFSDEVKTIINVIKGLSPEKVGGDLLGTIFHDLIPFEVRKRVAAFYTNVLAAELLAFLCIDKYDAKVADLAVGSGGLLVAAYRRKKSLLNEPFTQSVHKRFVEKDLLGVDVMPFAANIAACHLALQSPQYFTNKVQIAIWDSTDLMPGKTIPSVAELKSVLTGQSYIDSFTTPESEEKGVVSLGEEKPEGIELKKYDLVIMNPPFTRQERIPEKYKKVLLDRFSEYKEYLHGQLGYYGYFILLADRFLNEEGRIALVLPATVLRIPSCEGLRKLLSERYHVEHIITTWYRSAFSESVRFRETLLVARKLKEKGDLKTTLTVLKRLPKTLTEAREFAEVMKKSQNDLEDDKMAVKIYDYSKLRIHVKNWFKYVTVSDLNLIDLMEKLLKSDKLVQFSSVMEAQRIDLEHLKFKDFHGFILYEASRALKKVDAWVFDRIERDALIARHKDLDWRVSIPLNVLGRGLRRLSYVKTIDVSNTSDYLILSWFDGIKDMAKVFLADKDLSGFKSTTVEAWQKKFKTRKAHLLLSRRFDISAPGMCLFAFYSDEPLVGADMWCVKSLSKDFTKILSLWFNSTLNVLQTLILRTETRGAWMVVHDYILGEMLIPNPSKLSESDLKYLLKVFSSLKDIKFPSVLEQLKGKHNARMLIDKAWLKILGYEGDMNSLLDRLYDSLAEEIELLRRLMAEGDEGL